MKKTVAFALLAALLFTCAPGLGDEPLYRPAQNNTVNIGLLLYDLLRAVKKPTGDDAQAIERDLQAIRAVSEDDYEVTRAIAAYWQRAYLDPAYTLRLYDGSAAALADSAIPDGDTHAFVVLGYELTNGKMAPELIGRCETAAAAARAYPNAVLVCSGGATGPNNPEKHTEAGLMKAYLTGTCGIAPERILTDEKARNTLENAVNTFSMMREKGVRTMTIITSSYHQRWGEVVYYAMLVLYARRFGYAAEIVDNFSFPAEPTVELYREDAWIAAQQLGEALGLPATVINTLKIVGM